MSITTPESLQSGGIISPETGGYLEALLWPRDALLSEMHALALDQGIPIVNDEVGQLLDLLIRMHRPRHVVEFGTAIGYSTVYMARALAADARLTTFEIDPVRYQQAIDFLSRSGVEARIEVQLGDSRELVQRLDAAVDFAFLDAEKGEYQEYLEATLARMPVGGVVVVDNALMSGTVPRGASDGHWSQSSIDAQRAFNAAFVARDDLRGVVLPIGDGIAVGVRR